MREPPPRGGGEGEGGETRMKHHAASIYIYSAKRERVSSLPPSPVHQYREREREREREFMETVERECGGGFRRGICTAGAPLYQSSGLGGGGGGGGGGGDKVERSTRYEEEDTCMSGRGDQVERSTRLIQRSRSQPQSSLPPTSSSSFSSSSSSSSCAPSFASAASPSRPGSAASLTVRVYVLYHHDYSSTCGLLYSLALLMGLLKYVWLQRSKFGITT